MHMHIPIHIHIHIHIHMHMHVPTHMHVHRYRCKALYFAYLTDSQDETRRDETKQDEMYRRVINNGATILYSSTTCRFFITATRRRKENL